MLFLLSSKRRARLVELAAEERKKTIHRRLAITLILIYNMIGFADILSTEYAIATGYGFEANPLMRAAMDNIAWKQGWVALKLALQYGASAMVLWYPNKIVVSLVGFVVVTNGWIVLNNLAIGNLL